MHKISVEKHWNNYLKHYSAQQKDVYFTEEYVRLYESDKDKPECFVYQDGENLFLYPYLKRRIGIADKEVYDFETAYGYAGPLSNNKEPEFVANASIAFMNTCRERRIICGFTRFHPLLKSQQLIKAEKGSGIFLDRKTVAINLELSEQEIWDNEVDAHHKRAIKKAEKSGVTFIVDDKLRFLNDFVDMYSKTMGRRNADSFYFFNEDYFNKIKTTLGKSTILGLVFLNKELIAGALFYRYEQFGHYHLGGSRQDCLKFFPNNYLFFQMALYFKERGVKIFHLGGGTDSRSDNSLYRFKKRFSRHEFDFYIGKMIFDESIYHQICSEWESRFPEKKGKFENLLLKYRF